jgi:hypothetical protein
MSVGVSSAFGASPPLFSRKPALPPITVPVLCQGREVAVDALG